MQKIIMIIWITSTLLHANIIKAQVGIGTSMPDTSSVLDLYSSNKGLLIPRLNTNERDSIFEPATGLMIYNLMTNDIQVNIGTPVLPEWSGMKDSSGTDIESVTTGVEVSTASTTSVPIVDMTLSPEAGTYLVSFNGQYGTVPSVPISTAQGVDDLLAAYNALVAIPVTDATHGAIFGNDEILLPGVYYVAGAISTAGTLTFDGGGDTNSVFIIRTGGALAGGASTTMVLTNGAQAKNIFWVSEGALSFAAHGIVKGTMIANNAAASAADGVILEGRLFSTTGAIAFGPGTAFIPSGDSYIDLGVLSSFVMFTSSGAVSNTGASNIIGDVGTNLGEITGFEGIDGNIYGPGAPPNPEKNVVVSFGVYQDGVLVPNSGRTSDTKTFIISLLTMVTITAGQPIDIRWHVDEGSVKMTNRILTLVKKN